MRRVLASRGVGGGWASGRARFVAWIAGVIFVDHAARRARGNDEVFTVHRVFPAGFGILRRGRGRSWARGPRFARRARRMTGAGGSCPGGSARRRTAWRARPGAGRFGRMMFMICSY